MTMSPRAPCDPQGRTAALSRERLYGALCLLSLPADPPWAQVSIDSISGLPEVPGFASSPI